MESALTIKGQFTLPKALREHLNLRPGDRVRFFVNPDGTVVILPKVPVSSLRGILASKTNRHASLEDMEESIAAGVTSRFRRGNKS